MAIKSSVRGIMVSLGWAGRPRRWRGDRTMTLAIALLGVIGLAVLIGPWLYGASPTTIDFGRALQGPSVAHPLGTNDLGQDQLARLLVGGRVSLAVGVAAMAVAMGLGLTIGAIAGFYGGWLGGGLMRLTDLFLALAAMLEEIPQNYVQTARAKGLNRWRIITLHMLRNALIPVVTLVALDIPTIFTGALVTEQVFRVPGIGALLIEAIYRGDTPVVMAVAFIYAVLVVVFNLVADVLYGVIDPRVRYGH